MTGLLQSVGAATNVGDYPKAGEIAEFHFIPFCAID